MATERDALKALVAVLRERHHGRMPHEVQVAYDEACAALASAPAAPPVDQSGADVAKLVYGLAEMIEAEAKDQTCDFDRGMWVAARRIAREVGANVTRAPTPPAAEPVTRNYADSTPYLHVGESAFESWYQNYLPNSIGHKQIARDAYAAGMGDPLVVAVTPSASEPVAWTPGPNVFKDWCSQWFGPDADDDYLAKAVFALPPVAQRFSEPAQPAPQAGAALELAPWEKERFGVFLPDGRFEEIPTAQVGKPHPSGEQPRWVGGFHDAQLLRAFLITQPAPACGAAGGCAEPASSW